MMKQQDHAEEDIPKPREGTPSPQKCLESPERNTTSAAEFDWDQQSPKERGVKTSRTFRPSDRLLQMSRVASQQQTPETVRREKHPQHIRMGSNPELILN